VQVEQLADRQALEPSEPGEPLEQIIDILPEGLARADRDLNQSEGCMIPDAP
jgi:hypothetical protein